MRVLILSLEVWQDGTNGGNVLSNMFKDTGMEFAQIYCSPGEPRNELCTQYYQMTDSMVIHGVLKHRAIGRQFTLQSRAEDLRPTEAVQSVGAEQPNKKFYTFFRSHRLGIFYAAKNMAWSLSNWKHAGLDSFVKDFAPDIIFAPCYGDIFMQKLTRYVAELTEKKVISYISDDHYTLHHFSLSPYFWGHRLCLRHQLRKTFPYYSLVYTMTQTQKQQCERDLHANMKILMKSISFGAIPEKTSVEYPIRIVYAGGIYLNRWKTLGMVADGVRRVNQDGVKYQLDIYTGNDCTAEMREKLHDGVHCFLHPAVSQDALREIYHSSDIALHVESFDLKNRLAVRMSFSTKIVDCLSSGCAVMAICDAKQGGMVYLREEDAAICISERSGIYDVLENLARNPQQIVDYARKAKQCCMRNHEKEHICRMVISDFERYCN